MARKQWVDPRKTRRRCWIKGCSSFGKWVIEETGYRPGTHYDREHAHDPHAQSATIAEMAAYDRAQAAISLRRTA